MAERNQQQDQEHIKKDEQQIYRHRLSGTEGYVNRAKDIKFCNI